MNQDLVTNFWKLGDLTRCTQFQGTVAEQWHDPWTSFRIVSFTPNSIIFQHAQNWAGKEVALCDGQFDVKVAQNKTGLCMNRLNMIGTDVYTSTNDDSVATCGTNKGGYSSSYMNKISMPSYFNCLEWNLQNLIKIITCYADNVGQQNTSASSITGISASIWLPSQIEIFGSTVSINPNLANKVSQFGWYAAGNRRATYQCRPGNTNSNDSCLTWTRDPSTVYPSDFRSIRPEGTGTFDSCASRSYGICPCFVVGK